jgi:predicted DsbA family dithiol-disulfide isomerase
MKVEIYSDVVCPWCYIGERRFARALAEYPGADEVEVVFRPYQLDPSAPRTAVPLLDYLARRFGAGARRMTEHVGAAARGEGIEIRWDDAVAANTLDAHRLLRLAEQEHGPGMQRALVERLFDAHFTRGMDIADTAVLADLAAAVGMERARATAYLASGEGAREVRDEIAHARRLGVTAVPTFVFDGASAVSGAQPPALFREVLDEVAARAAVP